MSDSRRRILVVGCGAMGGLFAARLSTLAEVVTYDTDTQHVAQINAHGLRIDGASELLARLSAVSEAQALSGQHFDAVLMLTKSAWPRCAI